MVVINFFDGYEAGKKFLKCFKPGRDQNLDVVIHVNQIKWNGGEQEDDGMQELHDSYFCVRSTELCGWVGRIVRNPRKRI